MRRIFYALLALVVAVTTMVVIPRLSPEENAAEHCVVQVLGQKPSGELILSEPRCVTGAAARADLLVSMGVDEWATDIKLISTGITSSQRALLSRSASSILGVHYDYQNGPSITVTGSNCNGGYVNLSSSWVNRVSYTVNFLCSRIKHYDFYNLSGTYQSTWYGVPNLTYMSNRANSIQYTQ